MAADAQGSSETLGVGTKLGFTMQGTIGAMMGLVVAVYLGKFYVDTILLPAGLFAIAIAAGRAFDAITDPLMGYISDHTNSRWGRRKPWIFVGVLGNAVIYYMLLTPAESLSTTGVMYWFLFCSITSFLFVTMLNVPKAALSAELTLDAVQRVSLYGYMAGFVALGLVLGAVTPYLMGFGDDPRGTMASLAGFYVTVYLALHFWLLYRVPERREFRGRGETAFVPGLRRALRNKPFRIMFASHVITAIPVAIPAGLVAFFVQYAIRPDKPAQWTALFMLVYLVAGMLALPVWIAVARRKGKLFVFLCNSFIGVTGGAAMFTVGEGQVGLALCIQTYVGLQAGVWLFVGGAMHADVIDYDELHTGKRREAQFSALWSIIPKFSMIPGAALPLAVLGAAGYVPNAEQQSPEVVMTLRVLFSLVPAAFNAIGLSIMWWYPLSERNHGIIREGVAKHARGEAAEDPITGKTLPPPSGRTVDEDTSWFLDSFSARELRAYAERGTAPIASVWLWVIGCAALTVVTITFAVQNVDGFEVEPGVLPPLGIVMAGLSLAATLFHLLRVRPARKLAVEPVPRDVVRAHLASLA